MTNCKQRERTWEEERADIVAWLYDWHDPLAAGLVAHIHRGEHENRRKKMSYRKYTAAALRKKKTLSTGQADNLKLETKDGHRYWLSRMTREDGAPFGTNGVTVEKKTRGGWKEIAIYDGSVRG